MRELWDRLLSSMRTCTADEWFIGDDTLFRTITDSFAGAGSLVIGGQAGIAAVHLRRTGVRNVTCMAPGAGRETCRLLEDAGVDMATFCNGAPAGPDTIHLVFEYPPNIVPVGEGIVPRGNRFIASPLHGSDSALIPDTCLDSFLETVFPCRRAFLSGYQYLVTEQDFINGAAQLCRIRAANPLMRTHVECVSIADRAKLSMMVRHIFRNADSIGMNEKELFLLTGALSGNTADQRSAAAFSPVRWARDALALSAAIGLHRLHLHTFGTYILVLDPVMPHPEASRDALLLAAQSVVAAKGGGNGALSCEGLVAYDAIREAYGPEVDCGIFRTAGRVLVIVPALISQHINKTSGLGDMISSTAFVADHF
jgi:ADP-dependent phosphofructokinase/glucokinase